MGRRRIGDDRILTGWKSRLADSGVNVDFWKYVISPSVIAIKGNKCEHCGGGGKLDVHHTDYTNQTIHTLLVLCRQCHKNWHKQNTPIEKPIMIEVQK